ncbi:MAG: hypothetical protein ACOYUZ_01555 [Patescibacteria group bacterium]
MSEMPPSSERGPSLKEKVLGEIKELSSNREISRDQERIAKAALEDPGYALLANRALNQGTDPELIRHTMTEAFDKLAENLGISPEEAHAAIEKAHKMGPGSLAVDSKEEWVWLLCAKHSVDEAQRPTDPKAVLAETARTLVAFENYANGSANFEADARDFREQLKEMVKPIGDAPKDEDIPLYENDYAFYVAYRSGKNAAAVRSKDGLVFYGTDGSVTLEELGVKVDKQLSPYFGIDFPKQGEE